MQPATWYLGPLGDLRPLICPENGVERTVTRFGGVHESLSGARTLDVTGHRTTYRLTVPWLTPEESKFVEALHHRTVRGPFYLLDPLGTNRLGREAAIVRPLGGHVEHSSGGLLRNATAPAEIGVPATASEWSSYTTGGAVTLSHVPLLPMETVTFSVWLKSSAEATVRLVLEHAAPGSTATSERTVTVTPTWARLSLTATAPAAAVTTRPAIVAASTTGGVLTLAAAQLEHGSTPTAWDLGGAAPVVLVDQVERVSPHYPRNDLAVTLLEA